MTNIENSIQSGSPEHEQLTLADQYLAGIEARIAEQQAILPQDNDKEFTTVWQKLGQIIVINPSNIPPPNWD
jgi:hypothetical protein